VVAVESEVVCEEKLAGARTVIQADADDVAGIQVAEKAMADGLEGRRLDEEEQAAEPNFSFNWLSRSRAIMANKYVSR